MTLPQELGDAPISAKLLYRELEIHGPLTPTELEKRLRLSPTTVQNGLRHLHHNDLVDSERLNGDLRRRRYRVD